MAEDLTLAQLHRVIQGAFGWEDYHLHEFEIGSAKFGRPDYDEGKFDSDSPMRDERKCKFGSAIAAHRTFTYWYDFGDDWLHDVVVEGQKSMAAGRRTRNTPRQQPLTQTDGSIARRLSNTRQ